jgi:hypothetical protein
VLGTLLHEAAHGLADARGIQDTSRQGRYHSRRYARLAAEVGLDVAHDAKTGWSQTTVGDQLAEAYADVLGGLDAALGLWRYAEQQLPASTGSRNLLACACGCGRKLRVAKATLEQAPIVCGACEEPFELFDRLEPVFRKARWFEGSVVRNVSETEAGHTGTRSSPGGWGWAGGELRAARTLAMTPGVRPAWPWWRPAGLAWGLWVVAMLCLAAAAWLQHLLGQTGRPDLAVLDAAAGSIAAAHVGLATVGAVVASRQPRHPVGWLLLAFGVLGNASFVIGGYADYGLLARPGTLPAARLVAAYFPADAAVAFACLGFILLLTPTGSLPSPRWRWWASITAATPIALLLAVALVPNPADQPYQSPTSPFDLQGLSGPLLVAYQVALAIILLAVVAAAASLVVRFRRASGVERQQLRWVALAAALIALLFVVIVGAVAIGAPALPDPGLVSTACLVVLTLGISAATLRYRLYDLDRIISRTLSYGLLTVLLGGGYASVVLGLGQLAGRKSSLVVAVATLAVAGAFQPARRRVQRAVDRRFNRRRYDAAETIAAFSTRLRQQVDLDTLAAELLAVVDQTMEPITASLWLRPPPDHARPLAAIDN